MEQIKYDSIFNNGHTPMLIIDSETGEIRDANRAALNYYGYGRDKLLSLRITDINTLSQQEVFEEMQRARNEDRKFFRFKHRLSDGEIKEVEVYSGPIDTDNCKLLFSIIHDVEDKKKMELRIRHQQSYFENLYENSPEAIAILDNEFRVINVNSSFESIFQFKLSDIINQNITKVLCDEKYYDESSYIKDSIKRGEYVRKEMQRIRKDGKPVDVSFLGYPILSNGEQIGVYALYSDLSKQKEEKKEQENKIQMYIKMLKDEKLKAEEASRFKTQFIANMTHEIRTPVNGIVGIIELLGDSRLSDEQKEYLQMLEYSATRLSTIINDVLDIAKIEAGKLELRNVTFSIRELLKETASYYKIQAGRKGLDLDCRIGSDIPEFLIGDPDKLNQVLFNLLSNAVKFTDLGSISIDVGLMNRDDNKVSVRFTVSDTGIGIPQEKLEHVFEEFFQLETIKNRKYSGTGLGLSISSKLVQLMGSEIKVESECNKGCCFSFTVAFTVPRLQETAESGIRNNPANSLGLLPALKILVVEDDGINQKIIKNLLERSKCSVTLAANGKEALRILENRVFDVILMDIYMPEMNGYDTAKLIRKNEEAAGIYTPIIALTAAVQNDDRDSYITAGFDYCIAKPCSRDQILSAMAKVLKNRHKTMIFSLEPLISRLEGDFELLDEIIKEVVSSDYEKEFFGGIEAYIKEKNVEKLSSHIHKFKGSISHFQASAIDELLRDIKKHCKDREFNEIERLCRKLKLEYDRLKDNLLRYRAVEK